jgi:hypothetical protein
MSNIVSSRANGDFSALAFHGFMTREVVPTPFMINFCLQNSLLAEENSNDRFQPSL